MENTSDPLPLLILLALALPVFFVALGANTIWDANEAFYTETPRQMLLRGDYLHPWFNGLPRFNKPVLSYWIVAGMYHLFGTSVPVERVAIAAGALGIIAAAFVIGRALRSTTTGVMAALIVATAPRVVFMARRIFIDVYITMFLAIVLACFVQAERDAAHRRRWLLLMYVAMGFGALTKGPIAVVIPALVIAIWWSMERRWADARRMLLVPGIAIVLAIVAPWYAALYRESGWTHIRSFFFGENLERYLSPSAPDRNPFYYIPIVLGDLAPWGALLLLPLLSAWRRAAPGEPGTHAGLRRLLWLWIVVIVSFFSLSQTKIDLYVFPVLPAVAALVADLLVGNAFGAGSRSVRVMLGVTASLVVLTGAGVLWLFGDGYYAIANPFLVTGVLGATGLLALVAITRRRHRGAVLILAAGFVVTNYLFVVRVLPGLERLKPTPTIAAAFLARASSGAKLGFYDLSLPSLTYYSGRDVEDISSDESSTAFFARPQEVYAIMDEAHYLVLRGRVPRACIVARHPIFDSSPGQLLSGAPPRDVLLVTNQCSN